MSRDRAWAYVTLCGSSVFVVMETIFALFYKETFMSYVSSCLRITFLSNLCIFVTAILYLWNKNIWLFKTGAYLYFNLCMIMLTGLVFWSILFPTFFIGLSQYLVEQHTFTYNWQIFTTFQLLWNHSITPILFLIFAVHCFKQTNDSFIVPSSFYDGSKLVVIFFMVWMFINTLTGLFSSSFPVYGIFSNVNPYLTNSYGDSLFDIQILLLMLVIWKILVYLTMNYIVWLHKKIYFQNYLYEQEKLKTGGGGDCLPIWLKW